MYRGYFTGKRLLTTYQEDLVMECKTIPVFQRKECTEEYKEILKIPAKCNIDDFLYIWNEILKKSPPMRKVLLKDYLGTNIDKSTFRLGKEYIVCEQRGSGFYYSTIRMGY